MASQIKMKGTILCLIGLHLFLYGSTKGQRALGGAGKGSKPPRHDIPALYKDASQREPRNFVISTSRAAMFTPSCLMMLYGAAEGGTAVEMRTRFPFLINYKNYTRAFPTDENEIYNADDSVQSVKATRIFSNNATGSLRQDYVDYVKGAGGIEALDFGDTETAAAEMNKWAMEKTLGAILGVVETKDVDKRGGAICVNALYLKFPWNPQLVLTRTTRENFYIRENKAVRVEMMHMAGFNYTKIPGVEATFFSLQSSDDGFYMFIVLPNVGVELAEVEEKLKKLDPLYRYRNKTTPSRGFLSLPKFIVRSAVDLKSRFQNLGVKRMFEKGEANFSSMTKSGQFYVSKILQTVVFEMNNKGAKGSAGLKLDTRTKVNRPFIFSAGSLRSLTSVMGRITNPNESGNKPMKTGSEETVGGPGANSSSIPPEHIPQNTSDSDRDKPQGGGQDKNNLLAPLLMICIGWLLIF